MSEKLRRGLTWLCMICLVLGLLPASGRAAPTDVYFTAVNEQLLEVTQETMPFWSDGRIYVSNAIFDEAYRKDLGVFYSHSTDRQSVVLYAGRNALYFFPSTGLCYDNRGKSYSAKAISKGDYVFFPVDVVCQFFDLTYSYTNTSLAPLIRIKSSSVVLSDSVFIDAAGSYMRTRYQAYEKALADSQVQPQVPTPPPLVGEDPVVPVKGQRIALAIRVTEETAALEALEAFARRNMQGTFLLTAEQAEEMPDLVRSLVAGGQTVVLRAEEQAGEETAAELLRGREALWRAACASTRLVWLPEQKDSEPVDLTETGFRQIAFSVDYSKYGVDSPARARTVLERLTEQDDSITLLLGDDQLCGGLEVLLQGIQAADHKVVGAR